LFESTRTWGSRRQLAGVYWNATQGTPFYTPNYSMPASTNDTMVSPSATRVTWQVSPRNKLNIFVDIQHDCICYASATAGNAPEHKYTDRYSQRASAAFITRSHAFKVGFQDEEAVLTRRTVPVGKARSYVFNKGIPSAVIVYAEPSVETEIQPMDIGIFIQDQ